MAYIGRGLDNGVRNQFIFAATQGQISFSGADSDGKTLAMTDILYVDCFQNGVKLKPTTDYTLTSTTLTLVNAASLNDVVDIVSFEVFGIPDTVSASSGGTFGGGITATTGTFSGDVAINGASATHPLSVNGQIKSTGANGETLQLQTSSQYSGISFIGSDGTRDAIIDYDHTNGALGLKAHTSSHYINFMTGGYSERFRITDNGVTFNGDTAAANALDDYEEGTWTPADGSGAGMSLTVWEAFYTKIGRKVYIEIGFLIPSNSSSAVVRITGLPFTAKSGADSTGGFTLTGSNSGRLDYWLVDRGESRFGCSTFSNVGTPNSSYSNKQIKLNGSYTVA